MRKKEMRAFQKHILTSPLEHLDENGLKNRKIIEIKIDALFRTKLD